MATLAPTPRSTQITLASAKAGPFLLGFRLFSTDSLEVYVNGVSRSNWTLSAVFSGGYSDDASITFSSALAIGDEILIDGWQVASRSADYLSGDTGLVAKLNIELPRIWASIQELKRKANRGIRALADVAALDVIDGRVLSFEGGQPVLSLEYADIASAQENAAAAAVSAAQAALYDGIRINDVPTLIADVALSYTAGAGKTLVAAGSYIVTKAEGIAYQVAASAASDHHRTTAGGVKLYVLRTADGYLPLKGFGVTTAADLAAAIMAADGIGLDWGKEQISVSSAVSATLAVMRWKSSGAIVTYTGGATIASLAAIALGDGAAHEVTGDGLTFNAANKAGNAISFTQTNGTATATLDTFNLSGRNVVLAVGAAASANCIKVQGGFARVFLHDPEANGAQILTGAGVGGTRGVQGILVGPISATAGCYPLVTRIYRPVISNVTSQDATYQYDMDGISAQVLMTDVTNGEAACEIFDPVFENVWGREIKTQVFKTTVQNPAVKSFTGPTGGRLFPMIDIQTGIGEVLGGRFDIKNVVFDPVAGVVRLSQAAQTAPCVSKWTGGDIYLLGTASLSNVVILDSDVNMKMVAVVYGQTVHGGAIRNFALIRTNGFDLHHLRLDGIVCALTDALVRTEARSGGSAPYRSRAWAKNILNVGSVVPLTRQLVAGLSAWCFASADQCDGFTVASLQAGTAATSPAGRVDSVIYPEYLAPDGFGYVQGRRLIGYSLATATSYTLPTWGESGSCLITIKISGNDRNAYAILSMDSGGIVTISAGTSFNIGTTADPGTGTYRVWRSGGQLVLSNNSGSTKYMTIEMVG